MYSGSSKLGRGGGGGRGAGGPRNRSSFPPPPPHRPSSSAGRLPMGSGPRNRAATGGAAPAQAVEESFSLVSGNNPLAFAMIIRLTPDLVDEIRRLEAQKRTARIKFDSIPNNPSGNVIDVGGKEFKFIWSPDSGELCDIYEEHKSGEDGNDMLVESGCAWRKLNVQRILDESTTNHVKKRSEEAERKHKSRKAIVLDHANPPPKNQIKQLAAAEASPWKSHFKKKEPPPKKRKVEPAQVGGPIKSAYKSGSASTAITKHSVSPNPSPPERSGAPESPSGTGKATKSNAGMEDVIPSQLKGKEIPTKSEKEIPVRVSGVIPEAPGRKGNSEAKPMDLQSMLITLLKDKPTGMSIKSLEKAVGDTFPDCAKKIEPIIKKIAIYQAPGKYLLKGVDLEDLKKPLSESGSSPEDNHHQILAPHDNHDQLPAPVPSFVDKASLGELEEQGQLEQIDIQHYSPAMGGEKKASDNSEGHAGSGSDSESDSDSDSDSSDTGSESGSHSKSKSRSGSPAGSGSGSSSDSESDASSNSKEGSDEDVNIMTSDDEKDPKHTEAGVSVSLTPEVRPLQNGADENPDGDGFDSVDIEGHGSEPIDIDGHGSEPIDIEGHGSDAVDIENDLLDDEQEIGMAANATLHEEGKKPVEGSKPSSSYHDELQEHQNFIGNLFEDNFRHEQADSFERIARGKSKRSSDAKQFDEKSEHAKRLKAESLSQPPLSGRQDDNFFGSHYKFSPNRPLDDREANANFGSEKVSNQVHPAKSSSDFQQSSRRLSDQSTRTKAPDMVERPNKHTESSSFGRKFFEKNVHEGYPIHKDKASRESQHEESYMKDKKIARNAKEGGAGGKHSVPSDFYHRKHSEVVGKFKEGAQFSGLYMESSPKDNNKVAADGHPANGRNSMLQRELSDLELGELREPPEETPVKQFDRKGSFKLSESKPSMSENCNSDLRKGKPVGKITWDSGKQSPPNSSVGVKRTPEHHVEGSTRSHHRGAQSQPQHLSRVDHAELGPQLNRSADSSGKSRQNETGARMGVGLEGYGESHKKAPPGAPQLQESKPGSISHSLKDKTRTSSMADLTDGQRDLEGNFPGQKKRGSSSDEDNSYLKYEKDAPEYKGPIRDFSQYKEYVQEYRDKYDSYCSLNKILESYRIEFQKLGEDLEFSEGNMEKYNKIVAQLRESYRQCGSRHRRLKKVFVVLHQELKHLKQMIKEYALSYMKE
ncbi:hypothetical protein SLA2020_312480 [Shorea laevis]